MTDTVLNIERWDRAIGIRLPAAVTRKANLHAGQRVRVTVEGVQLVITPVANAPLTLEQRLTRFDPTRHGGEVMTSSLENTERLNQIVRLA